MAQIYQSSKSSEKADIQVSNPFCNYVSFNDGSPLAGGKLYFGLPGQDGEVQLNQKKVYVIQESGGAVAIEQPIVLSGGGIPQDSNGNPAIIAIDNVHSLKVLDSNGNLEYFAHTVVAKSLQGYSGVIPEESKTVGASTDIVFNSIEATTASFYASTTTDGSQFKGEYMRSGVDYTPLSATTIRLLGTFPQGTVILGRALDPTGQTVNVTNSTEPFFIYDNKTDVIEADLKVDSSVLVNGGDDIGDGKGGSYIVVAGGTGTDDGYNYITLNNGNQLKIKSIYQVFSGYSEETQELSSLSGNVEFNHANGNIGKLTLTENVSNFSVANVPASGELKLQIKIKQDSITPRSVSWAFNSVAAVAPGGTIPTVTQTIDAVDEYIVKTDDAGVSWTIYTIGQDIK